MEWTGNLEQVQSRVRMRKGDRRQDDSGDKVLEPSWAHEQVNANSIKTPYVLLDLCGFAIWNKDEDV